MANTARIQHLRRELLREAGRPWDRGPCYYCKREFPSEDLTLDHIVPRSAGGQEVLDNAVLACHPCNGKKGSSGLIAFVTGKDPWVLPLLRDDPRGVLRRAFHWRGQGANQPIHMRTRIDAAQAAGTACKDHSDQGDEFERWLYARTTSWHPPDVTCRRCLKVMVAAGHVPLDYQVTVLTYGRMWWSAQERQAATQRFTQAQAGEAT